VRFNRFWFQDWQRAVRPAPGAALTPGLPSSRVRQSAHAVTEPPSIRLLNGMDGTDGEAHGYQVSQ
jgi:hypothetical protein